MHIVNKYILNLWFVFSIYRFISNALCTDKEISYFILLYNTFTFYCIILLSIVLFLFINLIDYLQSKCLDII